jgi:hypothetical protein
MRKTVSARSSAMAARGLPQGECGAEKAHLNFSQRPQDNFFLCNAANPGSFVADFA